MKNKKNKEEKKVEKRLKKVCQQRY